MITLQSIKTWGRYPSTHFALQAYSEKGSFLAEGKSYEMALSELFKAANPTQLTLISATIHATKPTQDFLQERFKNVKVKHKAGKKVFTWS